MKITCYNKKQGVAMKKYKTGDIVTGKVTGISEYGIFVLLDDNTTGLIHISEISSSFVRNISDYVELNEEIECKVIDQLDTEDLKLKLSIKGLNYRKNKNHSQGIIETKSGFSTLKSSLNNWVKTKIEEMDKNEKK